MPPLGRGTRPLLTMVGGKRHAGDEDHDEPPAKRRPSPASRRSQEEDFINAEPESSDTELRCPPPRPKESSKVEIAIAPLPTVRGTEELKIPQKKSAMKQPETQATCKERAGHNRASKAKSGVDNNKENAGIPQLSNTSVQDDPFNFGMEYTSQRPNKSAGAGPRTFSKSKTRTTNIHSQQHIKKSSSPKIRIPRVHALNEKDKLKKSAHLDKDDASEQSIANDAELEELLGPNQLPDTELPMPRARKKRLQSRETELTHPKLSDRELWDDLAEHERLNPPPTRLQNQLGDWLKDQAPRSSQSNSSTSETALENLDEYLGQLPKEEEEGSMCPICKAPVSKEAYVEFWKGKAKTVRNQNAYCREHRVKSAREEYRSEGYPDIDWNAIPQRIRQHRMKLYKILNNEHPSGYRDRYKPIALTGKAATVPSRRKDLPEHVQEELESYALDDQSTYPGYYGPHGRRLITENVMKVLKNEIKQCIDPVVQGSGAATFVQAVLVPEMAIILISEDCRVDGEEAEEIRERTYEMGMLLNEEIEDQIELHESDHENEYYGR